MARFYGTVQGQRGQATRLGHSSIEAVAASWGGGVQTTLYTRGEVEWVRIELVRWHGRGVSRVLSDTPLSELQAGALETDGDYYFPGPKRRSDPAAQVAETEATEAEAAR